MGCWEFFRNHVSTWGFYRIFKHFMFVPPPPPLSFTVAQVMVYHCKYTHPDLLLIPVLLFITKNWHTSAWLVWGKMALYCLKAIIWVKCETLIIKKIAWVQSNLFCCLFNTGWLVKKCALLAVREAWAGKTGTVYTHLFLLVSFFGHLCNCKAFTERQSAVNEMWRLRDSWSHKNSTNTNNKQSFHSLINALYL